MDNKCYIQANSSLIYQGSEMQKLFVIVMVLFLSMPVLAKQEKENKAGGMRDDHVSEMGMEKGKAYAGTKEKKDEDDEEEMKDKKDKKSKKEKKLK